MLEKSFLAVPFLLLALRSSYISKTPLPTDFDEDLAEAYGYKLETLYEEKDFWTETMLLYFEQAFEAFIKDS